MTPVVLHPTPSWRAVDNEQIRATGLVLQKGAALMLGMILLLCAGAVRLASIGHAQQRPVNFAYTPEAALVFVLVASLIPFGIWQDEGPDRRTYHWSMPVARHAHTLTKPKARKVVEEVAKKLAERFQMQCDLVAHARPTSSMNASARAQYQSTNRINSDSASGE